jgi:LPXTG-site transpeptidase (sortase) family protein
MTDTDVTQVTRSGRAAAAEGAEEPVDALMGRDAQGEPEATVPPGEERETSQAADTALATESSWSAKRWAGLALTIVGLLVVCFSLYVLFFTPIQGERAQRKLLTHFKPGAPALRGLMPPEGAPVALLRIPAIHLDQAVVEGTSSGDLESGPGLMPGSPAPGMAGNVVIAGRRVAFGHPFADLGRLRAGDTIVVTDALGKFTYKVTSTKTVRAGQIDPIGPSSKAVLTLVTSNPPLLASGRTAVIATLEGRPASDAALDPKFQPSRSERALSGDESAVAPTIVWTELLALAIALTVFTYRRWRHPAAIYLISTPIILALMVLSFENVIRLFPPTL